MTLKNKEVKAEVADSQLVGVLHNLRTMRGLVQYRRSVYGDPMRSIQTKRLREPEKK